MTGVTSVEHRDSPYFGLSYYEEKFGAWFFGREAEGSKILTNLRAARLTLLHAESGVGKSSLLRAGVAWRLQRIAGDNPTRRGTARYVPIVFNSWKDDPVLDLVGAIRLAIRPFLAGQPEPELPTDRLDVAIGAASGAANASLLIMLDQFEEYFLYRSREPTPERFADEFARCINRADLRANFLIAIREDAYAGLGDLFKGRIANVYGNYLHVDYLDRASAEKAIREPLYIYNTQPDVADHVRIQDELVEAVLDQVRAFDGDGDALQGRVATPLLQLVMETVWKRELAEGSHEMRLSTLQSLRGVKMIVDAHLGKALSALASDERQTAIDVFDHLVTPSGGKIAESVPDLAKRTGHSEEQVGTVLDKLDHERIVRPIPAAPGQDPMRFRRYEIFHDVLAPTINRAIAAREEHRRTRRFRRLAALAAGLLIAALALGGFFVHLWRNAQATAESRQLAAAADLTRARDPELSALLALRALRLHYTSQAETALRNALPQVQSVRTFRNGAVPLGAAFDPRDANKVASAGSDGIVRIWDVETRRRPKALTPASGFAVNGSANSVAYNPAGTEIAAGYSGGTVVLFDARNGKQLRSINVGPHVNDVQFIGSTGALAIATQDGAREWQPREGSTCCFKTLSSTQSNAIAVDPQDAQEFAVATQDGTLILNQHSGITKRLGRGDEDADAEFSSDGSEVVTGSRAGVVKIFDLATSKQVRTLDAAEVNVFSVAFSPDGKRIVAGYYSGAARVWDISSGLQLTLLAGSASIVDAARFNATGSEVVTASFDGTVRVWHTQPRELQTAFSSSNEGGTLNPPDPVYAAEYSSGDGAQILTRDPAEYAYVYTNGSPPTYSGLVGPGNGVSVNSARFNRAGTEIVTADSDGTVDLWHPNPGGFGYTQSQLSPPIPRLKGPASYAAFSPDGSRIVVATSTGTAVVRNISTGQQRTLGPGDGFLISVAVFSPGGGQILTGDRHGQIVAWDLATGGKRALSRQGPPINDIEFNSRGTEFVTASDSEVTVWSARDDRQKLSISACPTPNTASFSPDGREIVTACADGSARVFDAATGQQLTVLEAANAGAVNSAAFSPDGKSILTAFGVDSTGGVRIWSSELATTSLSALERLAEQRITRTLTPAERKEYLTGTGA